MPANPLAREDLSPPAFLYPLSLPMLLALLMALGLPGIQHEDEEKNFGASPLRWLPEVLLSLACLASPHHLGPPWAAPSPGPSPSGQWG